MDKIGENKGQLRRNPLILSGKLSCFPSPLAIPFVNLPQPLRAPAAAGSCAGGILPAQQIRRLLDEGAVSAPVPVARQQVQPASLDLRLGPRAHRVRASFLPGRDAMVRDKLRTLGMHTMDLRAGAVLERGCVYLVRLLEEVRLGPDLSGAANPRSTTGRLDVFTRLIVDRATEFDRVPAGYAGPLYAEVSPRTFSVLAREGNRLSQLRFRRGALPPNTGAAGEAVLSVDLRGSAGAGPVGYRARRHADLIDLSQVGRYDPRAFWEPIEAGGAILLDPDDFYILSSAERVSIPPDRAAELVPYDARMGEFRVHYAGFFDPGFGMGAAGGTHAVLEVRSRDVPFVLDHGQGIGRLAFEPMAEVPDRLYGPAIGSRYGDQTVGLSRHFRQDD